jgi:hypothetical protein
VTLKDCQATLAFASPPGYYRISSSGGASRLLPLHDPTLEPTMRRLLMRSLPLVLFLLFFAPTRASAGVILITHGDTIKHLGDIADPQARADIRKETGKDLAVGFKYSYFGVFWIDLWTWGGEYCVYEGNNYKEVPPTVAAALMGKSESDLGKPFLYRFPLGLLIIGGCVVVFTAIAMKGKSSERRVQQLFNDDRYRGALQVMGEHAQQREAILTAWYEANQQAEAKGEPPPPEPQLPAHNAGYEAAIDHLIRQGVPREEAEKNLDTMLERLRAQQPA